MNGPPPSASSTYVALCAGFILTGIVNTVLGPLLPWLTARWHLSDAAAGSLFTIQFAGGLAGGAVSGAIAARVGAGPTLAVGHLLMAAGLAAMAWGSHAAGAAGMAVAGLGLGCVIPNTNLLAARLAPARSAAALGAVNLCWGLGAAAWPLIVASFAERASIQGALLFACVLLLLMAGSLVPVRFPRDVVDSRSSAAGRTSVVRLAIFGASIALYSGTEAAFGGWITEYARRQGGLAAREGWEVAASAFWGGLTAGRAAVAVWLSGRFETMALFCGLMLAAAAIALLLAIPGSSLILLLAALCGLGLAPVFPVTVAALAREFPSSVAGPMVALGSAGAAVLPWLVGAISNRTGSLSVGLGSLLLSLALLAALQAFGLGRSGRRSGPS